MDTNKELLLISPIPPSVNHYLAPRIVFDKAKKRSMVIMYETSEAKKYKRAFTYYTKEQAKKQGWIMPENKFQQIYCDAIYYFDRIDMDSNNYWKVELDAITEAECVWGDDNIVRERTNAIYYDSANPRVELRIHLAEEVGIFDNITQAKVFEDKCKSCSRYREGRCSIKIKASEGRIQKEIIKEENKCECTQYKVKKTKKETELN